MIAQPNWRHSSLLLHYQVQPALRATVVPRLGPRTRTALLNNRACLIEWEGHVEHLGAKIVPHGFIQITSYLDGGTSVRLAVTVSGKARPYFLVNWKPIYAHLPKLYARLKRFSLFKTIDTRSTQTVVLGRLVLAADGIQVTKTFQGMLIYIDAHHTAAASGQDFLGHSTLDNRRHVLAAVQRHAHRSQHLQDRTHHYGR